VMKFQAAGSFFNGPVQKAVETNVEF
jgi:hypothetical protein